MHPQFQGRAYGESPGTLPEVGYITLQELVSGYAADNSWVSVYERKYRSVIYRLGGIGRIIFSYCMFGVVRDEKVSQ
jgi:hypothetical protein